MKEPANKLTLAYSAGDSMETKKLPEPLTPAYSDIRDFGDLPIDVTRVQDSKFAAVVDPASGYYAMMLWFASWHRVPAASLPNDDRQLCHLAGIGRDLATWKQVKEGALYGWTECSDGNLYHSVLSEKALVAWIEKVHQRIRSGRGNAARWGCEFSEEADLVAKFHEAWEMLKKANPASKLILKGNPLESSKDKTGNPTGNPTWNREGIPTQSQGKVREGKVREDINLDTPTSTDTTDRPQATGKQSPKNDGVKLTAAWINENTDTMKSAYFAKMRESDLKATETRWSYILEDFQEHWINSASNAAKFKKKDWSATWANQVSKQVNYNKLKWKAEDSKRGMNGNSAPQGAYELSDNFLENADIDWSRIARGEG